MIKLAAIFTVTILMVVSQPVLAAARVAVGHFAPFAENIDDTAVNILVN